MNPQVSIIMATYNRSQYIVESLKSIQNQTYTDWECLIIDDGGTDNTQEVIAPILKEDTRFQYFKRIVNYTKGLPGCRNYGLDLAKGNYIIFFDDDDIAHPQNLELCVTELSNNDVSFCRYIREVFKGNFVYNFDYSKEYTFFYIDYHDLEKVIKNEIQINSCAVMWRKECFEKNRFTESLMFAEEWELYSRIILLGYRGISIDKTLFYGRKHPNSNTGEFYSHNESRRSSHAAAILLMAENLKKKGFLSSSILRYLITISFEYKEYRLFEKLLMYSQVKGLEKSRWQLFQFTFPIRAFIYRLKKRIVKKLNKFES